jgi:hypothetical protein
MNKRFRVNHYPGNIFYEAIRALKKVLHLSLETGILINLDGEIIRAPRARYSPVYLYICWDGGLRRLDGNKVEEMRKDTIIFNL